LAASRSYCCTSARYYFSTFAYTIENDETSLLVWTACLNATASGVVTEADSLLQ
jgi:hypothetical protein